MKFKEGIGWRCCYDPETGLYTAEIGGGPNHDLYEITKEIYDKVDAPETESPASLINEGRHLYMTVDDRCGPPYTVILDTDYKKLCPWADTITSGTVWDDDMTDAAVEVFASEADNREQRRKKREERKKEENSMKPKVYFTKEISPEKVLEMYRLAEKELTGKVAVKLHSGEEGNQNFLKPDFWKPIIDSVGGTVVECNTAYDGARNTTEKHKELIKKHGWEEYFTVDLMDAEGPDVEISIPNGKVIKKDLVGKNIANYDSMLVLSHFKGHPMGGYGGALKQLSIGCASSDGKAYIHSGGKQATQDGLWENICSQDEFLEAMADAAWAVVNYFSGNMVFVNVMKNMSVDCDCCAIAEDPCLQDMGILVSLDPVAIDQACIDKVYACDDPGKEHFIERVESRHGIHTIEAAAQLGLGSREYELIEV